MPQWSNQIPVEPRGNALPIQRTPAHTKLVAVITSSDLMGTYTHYYKGRTAPCEKPDCEPCRNGMPFRWHAYFACEEVDNALHFIFEVTAAGAEPFIQYRDVHTTLRGCLFQASRWKSRPNGRILVRTKPADLTQRRLPKEPDLLKCLTILWSKRDVDAVHAGFNPEKRTAAIAAFPDRGNNVPVK